MFSRRSAVVALFLLAVACFAAAVWWFAFMAALTQAEERATADLALASDRLTGDLQRYREHAVFLGDHPTLTRLVEQPASSAADADTLLRAVADKTGPLDIQLLDASGRVLASAEVAPSPVSGPAFDRALTGALGSSHFVDALGRRIFEYASPVFSREGSPAGTVVVSVEIATLERNWPSEPSTIFFTDDNGVVFVSNRSELILTARVPDAPTELYQPAVVRTFPGFKSGQAQAHELWALDGTRYLPSRAMHLVRALPVIGMTGEILLDIAPAMGIATLQSAVAAALCLAFGAFLYLARERLALEAAANADLEARVEARTQELSAANASLWREVQERQDAEAALKKAQTDLVQAGKLSALGQMSAGISHELNQPLMAIRSFAENADQFVARGDTRKARDNLDRISELARRMGRIIKNLRAFARQEHEPMTAVDIGEVVDAALELAHLRLKEVGVVVGWTAPKTPVIVQGGEVRLQQVVMNLISNAIDAMDASSRKQLEIAVSQDAGRVLLSVRDTGPGITEPEKIFDPFYTTKEVGLSEGVGLGLSISYGLVQSFGGVIKGGNHSDGGAEFTVELAPAIAERAA